MLREAEGALELVDVSGSLPALQRVAGLRTWSVQAKEGFFVSWDAAQAVRARLLLAPTVHASYMQADSDSGLHAGRRHAAAAQHVPAGLRAAAGALPARAAAPRRHRRLLHRCDAQDARAAHPRARPVRPARHTSVMCAIPALHAQHLIVTLFLINSRYVLRRRAAPAAEMGSEPAFSVPAARQAPPPAEALAAAAGLTPAAEASEQSPDPVPAAADAGVAEGAAAGPPPAAGQGGADPVGDAAYEEVVGLAEDAADAAKVFAQAIRQQVRSAWHLLQGLARVFSCEPCDPAARFPPQDIAVAIEAAADSAASVEAVAALVGGADAPAESESASTAGPAASAAPGPVRCCSALLLSRGACLPAVGSSLCAEKHLEALPPALCTAPWPYCSRHASRLQAPDPRA